MSEQQSFFYEALRLKLNQRLKLKCSGVCFLNDCSGLGQETSEKQAPSALDYVGIFNQAVSVFLQDNKKVSNQSALNTCIADYNKSVTNKRWRVDSLKRKIITNLLRIPQESIEILASHYDLHRHTSSGAIALSRFIPGNLWGLTLTCCAAVLVDMHSINNTWRKQLKSDLQVIQ